MQNKYSDYIIYVDESGDHSLSPTNLDYPVFVLAFCLFKKEAYTKDAVTKLKEFKFRHFGHDMVVLHENEIRRDKGFFKNLKSRELKQQFMDELTSIIADEDFIIIATVIKKEQFNQKSDENPYDIALKHCMEMSYDYLKSKQQENKLTHIIVEKRGKKEDEELELEFRRINDGHNKKNINMPFEMIMSHKQSNSAGLQLADLVARPIGINILKPNQGNRAFKIIKTKFCVDVEGNFDNIGLKIYP